MITCQHFIDGEYTAGNGSFDIENPATRETMGSAARGSQAEIDAAVEAARETFRESSWADMDGRLRGELMRNIARTVRAHAEELVPLEVADAGKTIGDARAGPV